MPLYTYVISFKGSTHVAQSSHSNFRGFINWVESIPNLSPTLKQELAQHPKAKPGTRQKPSG